MASRKLLVVVSLVSCLMMVGGGCSWMMVRPAERGYSPYNAKTPPNCTTGQAPPILDTLNAIGAAGTGVAGVVNTVRGIGRESGGPVGPVMLGVGSVSTILYGLSANYGYNETATCRRMDNKFQAEAASRDSSSGDSGERGGREKETEDDESLADKEILTIVEAAEMCGVERSVIREGLSSGELEGLRTDRGYELPRAEVVAYCSGLEGE